MLIIKVLDIFHIHSVCVYILQSVQ